MINVIVAEEMFGNELAWACLRGAGVLFASLASLGTADAVEKTRRQQRKTVYCSIIIRRRK